MLEGVEDCGEAFVRTQFLNELLVDFVAPFPSDLSSALSKVLFHVLKVIRPHAEVLERHSVVRLHVPEQGGVRGVKRVGIVPSPVELVDFRKVLSVRIACESLHVEDRGG